MIYGKRKMTYFSLRSLTDKTFESNLMQATALPYLSSQIMTLSGLEVTRAMILLRPSISAKKIPPGKCAYLASTLLNSPSRWAKNSPAAAVKAIVQ